MNFSHMVWQKADGTGNRVLSCKSNLKLTGHWRASPSVASGALFQANKVQ